MVPGDLESCDCLHGNLESELLILRPRARIVYQETLMTVYLETLRQDYLP